MTASATTRTTPGWFTADDCRIEDFRAVRRRVDPDGVFTSDLARRLAL